MDRTLLFPLPFNMHIGFVAISVIVLILCYIRKKHAYELYMLVGIVSTMFVYVCTRKPYFYILGAEELALLVMTIVDMVKVSKRLAAEEKAKEQAEDTAEDSKGEEA